VHPKVSSGLSQGFEEISYAAAAIAVNRTAWFFEESLGKPQSETFPVVSYVGPADLRYLLLPLALVECGYQVCITTSAERIVD